MIRNNQIKLLFIASVLVFLFLTSIPPKQEVYERWDPTISKNHHLGNWQNLSREDGAAQDQTESDTGKTIDPANEGPESNPPQTVETRLSKDTSKSLDRLIQIAEDDVGDVQRKYLGENRLAFAESNARKIFTCRSDGDSKKASGNRLEYDLQVDKGVTMTYSIADAALCTSHTDPSVIAQFFLGLIYHQGRGIPQNYQEALNWYRRAANNGFSHANYHLGQMYHNGDGVKQNYSEAARFYQIAADQGLSDAQNSLGDLYYNGENRKPRFIEAMKWYRKAAEQGNILAQAHMGHMYFWGEGVEQSFSEALAYYRRAAEQGDIEAMAQMGHIYEHGLGIGENNKKAQSLYLAVAQQADANTLLLLGVDWETEPIQLNDKVMAYLWYSLSAHKGLKHARQNRSFVAKKMTVAQIMKAEQKSQHLIKKMAGKV